MKLILLLLNTPDSKPKVKPSPPPKGKSCSNSSLRKILAVNNDPDFEAIPPCPVSPVSHHLSRSSLQSHIQQGEFPRVLSDPCGNQWMEVEWGEFSCVSVAVPDHNVGNKQTFS
ncbi:hypothetical protein HGM15179_007980 [Zosterops borbonicus]|uniref:Uncharacterized protein n=1 Tax=Zosterops borbonicus TaxID=364589 RepID=A0A8K1LMK1_9PASS|nr:hypothetical protein HGM15179_007980 [Zosterops borbonicus]